MFSKVWPPMKLIFRLLLVGVQNLKPAELYQNVLQLFFSFSQFIFSLSRIYYGSARISIKHFVVFLNRLMIICDFLQSKLHFPGNHNARTRNRECLEQCWIKHCHTTAYSKSVYFGKIASEDFLPPPYQINFAKNRKNSESTQNGLKRREIEKNLVGGRGDVFSRGVGPLGLCNPLLIRPCEEV